MAKCREKIIREMEGILTKDEVEFIFKRTEKRLYGHIAHEGQENMTEADIAEYRQKLKDGETGKNADKYKEVAGRIFDEMLERKKKDLKVAYIQAEANIKNESFFKKNKTNKDGHSGAIIEQLVGRMKGDQENLTLEGRVMGILGLDMARMTGAIDKYLNFLGGKINEKDSLDIIGELDKPGSTGNKHAADLVKDYTDWAAESRARKNELGADIGFLKDRHLPQSWDPAETGKFGLTKEERRTLYNPFAKADEKALLKAKARDNFLDAAMERVNPDKYLDYDGNPLSEDDLREVLGKVFDTIVSGGLSNKPVIGGGSRNVAESLAAHRELHFKSALDWYEFNKQMGSSDILGIITKDIQQSAIDTALLEVYGPDPAKGFRRTLAMAKFYDSTWIGDSRKIENSARQAEHIFEEISGLGAKKGDELVAKIMTGVRQWMVATKLGSVLLSQVNDLATYTAIAQTDGLGIGRALEFAGKNLDPTNKADKLLASKLGFAAQNMINDVSVRFGEASKGVSLPSKFANFTIRAGGMKWWTDSMQRSYQMLVGSHMADAVSAKTAYGDLDSHFQQMLSRYGIKEKDWQLISKAEPVEIMGHKLISPVTIKLLGDTPEYRELAIKVAGMMSEESRVAVVEPGARQRVWTNDRGAKGTKMGELSRSFWLFKSFSIALTTKVLPRIFEGIRNSENSGGFRAGLAAHFTLGMIVAGGVAYQMKEITKGKNPRDITDPGFWVAATLQSGGLGIMGDLFLQQNNRFGQGWISSVGGPVLGTMDDLYKLSFGNFWEAAAGKETHFGAELLQTTKNNAPFINLFYTRAALDHLLFFAAQDAINPGYLRRMKNRVEKQSNTTFWWDPQDRMPERGPDLGAAFGGNE